MSADNEFIFAGADRRESWSIDDAVYTVDLDRLRDADSPRVSGMNNDHIRALTEIQSELPPILVRRRTMQVIDGMHRVRAAEIREQSKIKVKFFEGDEHDAFILGVRANITHGLPLTLADREAAAMRILAMLPDRSNRWIAHIVGLAPNTVADIRRNAFADHQPVSRLGKDGRYRPVDAAAGRLVARNIFIQNPEISLREAAKEAGISPATAKDVREKLRASKDPSCEVRSFKNVRGNTVGTGEALGRFRRSQYATRDDASLLDDLTRDPSVRSSETGRNLLQGLRNAHNATLQVSAHIDTVPSNAAYILAEIGKRLASQWLSFSKEVEARIRAAGRGPRHDGSA